MPTPYSVPGSVLLTGVSINVVDPGNFFGSTLSWTGIDASDMDTGARTFTDQNDNGLLSFEIDTMTPGVSFVYTGYTFSSGGVNYPVMISNDLDEVRIMINEDGSGQTTIPSSGTSNEFNPEASGFLCFAAGTSIATPDGSRTVETLSIGDEIETHDGRIVAVKWIGRQTVLTRFGPAERLMPVRFAAGSLGDGVPHADLTVTADHAMLVDGVLCNAGALVNGTTITRVPLAEMGETFTVYHVETEEHEIILANGAPAETFIDTVGRQVFDNYTEFEALYGVVPDMDELPLPRAVTARQVPMSIRRSLGRIAAA